MVYTELKFVRLMEELDAMRDEMSDLGGEFNSIEDRDADYETHDEEGDILPDSFDRLEEIEILIEILEAKETDIAKQLGVTAMVLETHFDSCITNRWEIYAQVMSADIVPIHTTKNRKV